MGLNGADCQRGVPFRSGACGDWTMAAPVAMPCVPTYTRVCMCTNVTRQNSICFFTYGSLVSEGKLRILILLYNGDMLIHRINNNYANNNKCLHISKYTLHINNIYRIIYRSEKLC